jgi:uncharacterized protein (DUF1499 family)
MRTAGYFWPLSDRLMRTGEIAGRLAPALSWSGAGIAIACALAAAAAGPGYWLGLWDFRTGFTILRWAAYIAAGAGAAALAGFILAAIQRNAAQAVVAVAGIAIAAALVLPAWNLQQTAAQVPRIHDITTDTDNPPQFVALLETRMNAPNGAAYAGERIASQQKAAYPDIQPALLPLPPAQAFERALAAARAMGWEIAAAVPAEGRIEATATTRWFRFKDDVVIRIVPHANGSRLDIRSMSRIGRSDLGANAKRIREFLAKLRAGL